jgi:catalase
VAVGLSPEQAIDAANRAFGRHSRSRALHAKGVVCGGVFTPSAEAAALTRAAHLQGPSVPVTVRFSNGSGNPEHADAAPDPRGLAVKFYLPDGSRTDIVAVSSPRFPTRTPEGFVELLEAQAAGAAAAWKMPLWLARHREALRVLPVVAPTLMAPQSYAVIPYYGLHAFRWVASDGAAHFVRYTLAPQASGRRLRPWEARRRARDYLQAEIRERVGAGTVTFTLELQIAEPGDPIDDPSAAWPSSRRRVRAGVLQVTQLDSEREQGDDVLVFDPTRLTDGIECSDDPVLLFRPRAYSESVRRRTAT